MANRIRVYEIAKELGVDSKDVITALTQIGVPVKNHMAALTDEAAEKVKQRLTTAAKSERPQKPTAGASAPSRRPAAQAGAGKRSEPQGSQRTPGQAQTPQRSGQTQPQERQTRGQAQRPTPQPQVSQKSAPSGTAPQPGQRPAPQRQGSQTPGQVPGRDPRHSPGPQGSRQPYQGRGGQRSYQSRGPQSRGPRHGGGYRGRRQDNRSQGRRPPQYPGGEKPGARRVTIQGPIGVRDLASLVGLPATNILRALMSAGMLISINQNVPAEVAVKIAEKLGCIVTVKEPEKTQEELIASELEREDDPEVSVLRPPVVTVMGHVDHGKTSLLDAMRDTNVTAKEAGGITQHIGASLVEHGENRIIFLDTPGHEAFTAMRARGAKVTDVAVLVVAADDGVMPQTIEAINHAKAAGVPIIVALNKMDKPGVKPDRVKQQLSDAGLVPEEWGGDTVIVPVSAKTREGVDDLLEMIVLVAEMQEVKTDPTRKGRGYIIESQMDKGRGPVATALIRSGVLQVGDVIITDTTWGRIRTMFDARGRQVKKAGPATPVELVGLEEVPLAGDMFLVVDDEKIARDVSERRKTARRAQELESTHTMTLEELFKRQEEGVKTDLSVIVKSDVQGSLEAILQALGKVKSTEVRLNVIHSGVGAVIESDVMLAKASGNARILGFNVRPDAGARSLAEELGIEIRTYRVIYDLLDDIDAMLKGLLKPKTEEVVLGRAEVRQTFHVPRAGTVAGCYVTEGKVGRQASVRLLRDGVIVYEGKMSSLRRFKDDVSEVSAGYECGIGLERFQDIKPGDVIEAFTVREVPQS
ncbi:MAG TPA: translation initiation factor IF-2 [Firmicutes bacterium]|jgi:translation initiation factor IF-2|nr:translation initiation factor IF-2 [Candidatus Fermentithermobacillaceae bacterium]